MDKHLSPKIIELYALYIEYGLKNIIPKDISQNGDIFVCGMEVAGGIVSSQLAGSNNESLNKWLDYFYIRKERKTSGTAQQLEGPQFITSRTASSSTAYAIWVDDALSTGSSLKDGIIVLKEQYNIEVIAALYLVDRSSDRKSLKKEFQHLADPIFDNVVLGAVFDLKEVDDMFKVLNPEKYEEFLNLTKNS